MKKIRIILVILLSSFLLFGCIKKPHKHKYTADVINPTCLEDGYTTYSCSCGKSYVDDYITALGHTYGEWEEVTSPTCLEEGLERRECTACNHEETRTIDSLGHDYEEDWTIDKEPTCIEAGSKSHHCVRCEDKKDITEIELLSHTYGEWEEVTSPTCLEEGLERRECTACNHEETRTIDSLGHDYEEDWTIDKEPTCIEAGSKSHHCVRCEDKKDITEIELLSHTYGEWEEVTSPTCLEEGLERRECTACNHEETRTIDSLGHDYIGNSNVCSNCGKIDGLDEYVVFSKYGDGYSANGITSTNTTKLVLPSTYQKLPVISVGTGAFINCSNLTDVTIPKSVISIGAGVFNGCSRLVNLNIPFIGASFDNTANNYKALFGYIFGTTAFDGATSTKQYYSNYSYFTYYIPNSLEKVMVLGGYVNFGAFNHCENIKEIILADGISSIGNYAFSGCSSLRSISFSNIEKIGNYAFKGTVELTDVYITGEADTWGKILFKNEMSTPMYYAENLYLNGKIMTDAVVNESVSAISVNQFMNIRSLTKITIGKSVKTVGTDAFLNCTSLKEVYYGGYIYDWLNIKFTSKTTNPLNYGADLYFNNNLVTEIYVSSDLIGDYQFYGCKSLNKVVLYKGVTSIGFAAFGGCCNIETMDLPYVGSNSTLTSASSSSLFGFIFGDMAYDGGIETKQYYSSSRYMIYYIPSKLKTININQFVNNIFYGAFYNCENIENVTLRLAETKLGEGIFYNCNSLDTVTMIGDPSKTIHITLSDYMFYGCEKFRVFSNDRDIYVDSIGNYCFYDCILFDVSFVEVFRICKSYGDYAFYNSGITDLYCGNLSTIGDYCFAECSNLTNVNLSNVISIGSKSFYNDTEIQTLEISRCWSDLIFDCMESNPAYYAKVETKNGSEINSLYVSTSGNYQYCGFNSVEYISFLNDSITSIGFGEFAYCTSLQNIYIPENITVINKYAFEGCSNISEIGLYCMGTSGSDSVFGYIFGDHIYKDGIETRQFYDNTHSVVYYIPKSLQRVTYYGTTLPFGAFYGIKSLTEVLCPNVETIGQCAFQGSGLTGFFTSAVSVGSYAFKNCLSLKEVYLNSVLSIGKEVFNGCNSLQKLTTNCIENDNVTVASEKTLFGYLFGKTAFEGATVTKQNYSSSRSVLYYIPDSLEDVTIYSENILYGTFMNCSNILKLTIGTTSYTTGESLLGIYTNIPDYSFYNCTKLYGQVPNVEVIGNYAFTNTGFDLSNSSSLKSIGDYAFAGCQNITKISTNCMEYIGRNAFDNCTSLNYVFVSKCKSISSYAFKGCTSLTEFRANNYVNIIKPIFGEGMLSGCIALEKIEIPHVGASNEATKASISTDFGYIFGTVNYEGAKEVIQLHGKFYIPSSLNSVTIYDYKSTSVNLFEGAFYGCDMIQSIDFYCNLDKIPAYAFYNCSNLQAFNFFQAPFTEVGNYAFYGCIGMNTIKIPQNIKKIGAYAFATSGLNNIDLPISIESYGDYLFKDCVGLSINYSGKLNDWLNINFISGVSNPMAYAETFYMDYILFKDINIPYGVTSIGNYAFYGWKGAQKLNIPETVQTIGNGAFAQCNNLEYLFSGHMETTNHSYIGYLFGATSYQKNADYVPSSLKKVIVSSEIISSYAFYNAVSIENIELRNAIQIQENAFAYCTSLIEISLPYELTSIGDKAFDACKSLTQLVVPDNVTYIGEYSLRNCCSLEKLVVPYIGETSTSLYENAVIGYWFGLNYFYPVENMIKCDTYHQWRPFSGSAPATTDSKVYYPASLKEIEVTNAQILHFGALSGLTMLEKLTLNDEILNIENYAFANDTSLKKLILPDSVSSLNESCFLNVGLEEVVMPSGMVEIQRNFFLSCQRLQKVVVSAGTEIINSKAFKGLTNLTELVLSSTVRVIGDLAFAGCEALQKIEIPESVTEIGNNVFDGCVNLVELVIPRTVEIIGNLAFNGLEHLESFIVESGVLQIGKIALNSCAKLVEIVIDESVEILGDISITTCEQLEKLDILGKAEQGIKFAIDNCPKLLEINCDVQTEKIVNFVVNSMENLSKISIGDRITEIIEFVVENCPKLSEINISNKITELNNFIVKGCDALRSLFIWSPLTSISLENFNPGILFEKIVLPKSLTTIKWGSDAVPLYSIYYQGTEEEWLAISGNDYIDSQVNVYFYSSTIPETEGKYWHYDVDEYTPVIW